jgi:AcrR family transcriptional regulator
MARRADHSKEELQSLILDAAWRIVGHEGFKDLTARKIAADVKYAPGTIYNNFKSMEDIYLQINSRTLDILYKALSDKKCNDPEKPMKQNLKAMASVYARFAQDYRPYWLMLFNSQLPEGRKEIEWYQEKIEQLFNPLEKLLSPLFLPKQQRKRKLATRALWASIHGLCFLQETGRIPMIDGKNSADEMSHYLIETFIDGITGSQ